MKVRKHRAYSQMMHSSDDDGLIEPIPFLDQRNATLLPARSNSRCRRCPPPTPANSGEGVSPVWGRRAGRYL